MKNEISVTSWIPKELKLKDLRNKENLIIFMNNNPDKTENLLDRLEELLNESYQNELGNEHLIESIMSIVYDHRGEENEKHVLRHHTYEVNHGIISSAITRFVMNQGYFPSVMHLGMETGLSRKTIYKHIKNGLYDKYSALVNKKHEYMVNKALEKLFYIGVEEKNASALKSYIELAGGLKAKQVNNYVQINNLKVSANELDQLPQETLLEIENLLKSNLNQ